MGRAMAGVPLLWLVSIPTGAVDLPQIVERGSLRVLAVLDPQRPEFFSTKPEAPGFDKEVLESFARMHKVRLEVVPLAAWPEVIPALVEGRGDVIAGGYRVTSTKRRSIAFTSELFPTRLVVVTRKPRRPVRTLEELREERVGTVKGTALAEAVAAAGVPPADVDDAIPVGGLGEALRSGRVTAVVWGLESAVATQRQDPDLQIGLFLGPPGANAFGLRKEDRLLRAALDTHIENMHRSGAWSRLVVRYFGAAATDVLRRARAE